MNKNRLFFYFLSFLEGASVMAAELLGAKMLAPYFGTSLYIWSAVLAVTLGGLAMGYFWGGVVSENKKTERSLYYVLLLSAIFLILMPVLAREVMVHTASFSLLVSCSVSSAIFLFPPVFFMGMVSPLIVKCIASPVAGNNRDGLPGQREKGEDSGKAAGTVYAISTLGGILSTFLFGFYIIPDFGLAKPAIIMGVILGIVPLIKLITSKKKIALIFLPIIIGTVFFSFNRSKAPSANSDIKILYSGEGLLGQIIVADYQLYEGMNKAEGFQRILFVNRSTQTVLTVQNGEKKYFEYVNLISEKTGPIGIGSSLVSPSALILGLGGGSVANELVKKGFRVDVVELDKRMADLAGKYFELDANVNVHIDDARHFVRNQVSGIKYQVIVLDAFVGEVNPHHLFTKEFFSEIKYFLSDSGTFFINGNGYWNGEAGKGMRSVCKTLINSGFDVEVIPTGKEEDYRNLVFISKKTNGNSGGVMSRQIVTLNLDDATILTDEKPQLEILNAEANRRWREACIKYFLSGYYSKRDMLLFK